MQGDFNIMKGREGEGEKSMRRKGGWMSSSQLGHSHIHGKTEGHPQRHISSEDPWASAPHLQVDSDLAA